MLEATTEDAPKNWPGIIFRCLSVLPAKFGTEICFSSLRGEKRRNKTKGKTTGALRKQDLEERFLQTLFLRSSWRDYHFATFTYSSQNNTKEKR